jgi:hypothetical protein
MMFLFSSGQNEIVVGDAGFYRQTNLLYDRATAFVIHLMRRWSDEEIPEKKTK